MTSRKFYGFNSPIDVEKHINEVKTMADLEQLRFDLISSETNLAIFNPGMPGVCAIDYASDTKSMFNRHVFVTASRLKEIAPVVPDDCDSYSVVAD